MSGIGQVQSSGDGYFLVNGQKMDLGALMMMLQIDRTKALDEQIADQMKEIQDRNKMLKALNDLLSWMRKNKAEGRDDDGNTGSWSGRGSHQFSLPGYEDKGNKNVNGWMSYFGYHSEMTDVNCKKSKKTKDTAWDNNIELIKGKIDGLNSESQLDMIRLQSMIDKRNQAFEMASNTLQKDQKTRDSIVGNFR